MTKHCIDRQLSLRSKLTVYAFSRVGSQGHPKDFGVNVSMLDEEDIVPESHHHKARGHSSMDHHVMQWSIPQQEQYIEEAADFVASISNEQPKANGASDCRPTGSSTWTQLTAFNVHFYWEKVYFAEITKSLDDFGAFFQSQHRKSLAVVDASPESLNLFYQALLMVWEAIANLRGQGKEATLSEIPEVIWKSV